RPPSPPLLPYTPPFRPRRKQPLQRTLRRPHRRRHHPRPAHTQHGHSRHQHDHAQLERPQQQRRHHHHRLPHLPRHLQRRRNPLQPEHQTTQLHPLTHLL